MKVCSLRFILLREHKVTACPFTPLPLLLLFRRRTHLCFPNDKTSYHGSKLFQLCKHFVGLHLLSQHWPKAFCFRNQLFSGLILFRAGIIFRNIIISFVYIYIVFCSTYNYFQVNTNIGQNPNCIEILNYIKMYKKCKYKKLYQYVQLVFLNDTIKLYWFIDCGIRFYKKITMSILNKALDVSAIIDPKPFLFNNHFFSGWFYAELV